jgi:phosphoenolpyruvate carboxylase
MKMFFINISEVSLKKSLRVPSSNLENIFDKLQQEVYFFISRNYHYTNVYKVYEAMYQDCYARFLKDNIYIRKMFA